MRRRSTVLIPALLVLCAALTPSGGANAAKGNGSSGGGGGLECASSPGAARLLVLDYHQAVTDAARDGIRIRLPRDETETLRTLMTAFDLLPGFQARLARTLRAIGPISSWTKSDLEDSRDQGSPFRVPPGCAYRQLAFRDGDTIHADAKYAPRLSGDQRAILRFHEALYWMLIEANRDADGSRTVFVSAPVRRIVGAALRIVAFRPEPSKHRLAVAELNLFLARVRLGEPIPTYVRGSDRNDRHAGTPLFFAASLLKIRETANDRVLADLGRDDFGPKRIRAGSAALADWEDFSAYLAAREASTGAAPLGAAEREEWRRIRRSIETILPDPARAKDALVCWLSDAASPLDAAGSRPVAADTVGVRELRAGSAEVTLAARGVSYAFAIRPPADRGHYRYDLRVNDRGREWEWWNHSGTGDSPLHSFRHVSGLLEGDYWEDRAWTGRFPYWRFMVCGVWRVDSEPAAPGSGD